MVAVGHGQAILGGRDDDEVVQSKIYVLKCSQNVWDVTTLDKELSIPRERFMAIPIPDHLSECISESRLRFYISKAFANSTCEAKTYKTNAHRENFEIILNQKITITKRISLH